jgi:hypothetical protein
MNEEINQNALPVPGGLNYLNGGEQIDYGSIRHSEEGE